MFRSVVRTAEFERDAAKLRKRFRTIEEDLRLFVVVALADFHENGVDNGGIVRLSRLGFDAPLVFKARKFACRSLKGRGAQSGIRVIYSYDAEHDRIELIEIYHKGDQENEDRARIARRYPHE